MSRGEREFFGRVQHFHPRGSALPSIGEGQRSHKLTLYWSSELAAVGNNIRNFANKFCPQIRVRELETTSYGRAQHGTFIVAEVVPKRVLEDLGFAQAI